MKAVLILLAAAGVASAGATHAGEDLGRCRARIERLRSAHWQEQARYLETARADQAFALGEPNPDARDALRSVLGLALKAGRPWVPRHTLECRTWSCKAVVFQPADQEPYWVVSLHESGELGARVKRMLVNPALPSTALPGSDRPQVERHVFLGLVDPSGEPGPPGPPRPAPKQPAADGLPACQAEGARLEKAIATFRAGVADNVSPQARFEAAADNPALRDEMRRQLVRILQPSGGELRFPLVCHGDVCRLAPAPDAPDDFAFRKQLIHDDSFRARFAGASCCAGGFFFFAVKAR